MFNLFNAVNAGAGLGLATPLTAVTSVALLECIYSVAECLYDHIKLEMFQTHVTHFHLTSAPGARHTNKQTTVLCSLRVQDAPARAVAFIISYQSVKNYEHAMSWSDMKLPKRRLKLPQNCACNMLYTSYIKNMSLKWFSKVSPSFYTLDSTRQFISRD